jgi:ech hydrogenase subunit C
MAYITKSPWIIHYDGSSCNGCDIEVLACLTPMYDVERFGVINTGNPKHADIFLVTGSVNEQNIPVVKQIYSQMPNPKVVVAIGICATSGGIFRDCYNIIGGVDKVIPVDVYVPGCAARPEAIIDGVVKGLGVLAEKQAALAKGVVDAETPGAYKYAQAAGGGSGTGDAAGAEAGGVASEAAGADAGNAAEDAAGAGGNTAGADNAAGAGSAAVEEDSETAAVGGGAGNAAGDADDAGKTADKEAETE